MTEETSKQALASLLDDAKKKKFLEIAKELIGKHHFKTLAGKKNDKVFRYDNGTYKSDGEITIRVECQTLLGKMASNHAVSEIVGHIKRMTYSTLSEPPEELINVMSCILNVKTLSLQAHSPALFFTWQIPIKYNPEVKCPKAEKFLTEILSPEDIALLQEYLGFCLYKRYFIKRALICVGEPDTGKTTTLTLLTKVLGSTNVSSESIQRITSDKFSAANLQGKLANIYDELPYNELENAGGFKIVTGGGFVAAEEKFGDRWQFINFAKFIYACNHIPKIRDSEDMAYYGRWLIIRFANVIPKEQQNPFLMDELTTENELSGLLNWALEGLSRLLKNKIFSYNLSDEDNRQIMLRNSEPLAMFVQDCLQSEEGRATPKDELYSLYCYHAHQNKLPVMTKTKLTQQLPRFAPYVTTGQNRLDGKLVECYRNAACKDFKDFFKIHEKQQKIDKIVVIRDVSKSPETTDNDTSLSGFSETTPESPDISKTEKIREILAELLAVEAPLPLEALERGALARGFTPEQIVAWIAQAKQRGDVYEPRSGFLAVLK